MRKRNPIPRHDDGEIYLTGWLERLTQLRGGRDSPLVHQAAELTRVTGSQQATSHGDSCLHQGLVMADLLAELGLDDETIIAGILYGVVQYAGVPLEVVEEQFGAAVRKLIEGTQRMDAIHLSHGRLKESAHLTTSIDNLRKMLLAMVDDVRVVLLKLVERLAVLRHVVIMSDAARKSLAQETIDIYAPLANRLGIGQLKWQLEDFAFRYLQPEKYKEISKALQMRLDDREKYLQEVRQVIIDALEKEHIVDYELSGRTKHIYSIYKKMQRKQVDIQEIYDVIALRLIVPTIEDCYTILSVVHAKWQHIPQEFDDYVANPKPNGYRSIHTAIVGPGNRNVEIQIRTRAMHDEAELGVAAHWMYKEGAKSSQAGYEAKIAWLRQVMDWQKEMAEFDETEQEAYQHIFSDRIYVFTPFGDVIDLPKTATPLDFAYTIHTDVGHRCKGAKVNDTMVPLTHHLKMGDKVEILTSKEPNPSRDWLNPQRGYLNTPRARAKLHHYFRVKEYDQNLQAGEAVFEKECKRAGVSHHLSHAVIEKLNFKTREDLLAALGHGDLRIGAIINALLLESKMAEGVETLAQPRKRALKVKPLRSDFEIAGLSNLLTHIAKCCKPVPGDEIIGYVTLGQGISIHRQDCTNIVNIADFNKDRLIAVNWGTAEDQLYSADLDIIAQNKPNFVREITNQLSYEKIPIMALQSQINKADQVIHLRLTIEIGIGKSLSQIIQKIQQMTGVLEVKRS